MTQDNKFKYEIETVINGEIKKPNFLYETSIEATTEFNKFCELCCFNMFPKETRFMVRSVPNVNGTVTLFNNSFEEKQILLSFSCEVKNNEKSIIEKDTVRQDNKKFLISLGFGTDDKRIYVAYLSYSSGKGKPDLGTTYSIQNAITCSKENATLLCLLIGVNDTEMIELL